MTFAVRCGPDAHAWVDRCAADSGLAMSLVACPAARAVVEVRPPDGAPLSVELAHAPRGFRVVGAYGVSPVGEFADWKAAPIPTQRAFAAVVGCVERAPPEALLAARREEPAGHLPALPIAAAALIAALAAVRRPSLVASGLALVATTLVALLRRLLVGVGFFHQNGQGPDWVLGALRGDGTDYGPGYAEVFGAVAARAARPDLAVFGAMGVLSATAPVAAWVLARSLGAPRPVALALAAVPAVDPVLARLSGSESYFGAIASLCLLATATLAAGFADARRTPRLLAVAAAALLLAQAARIHPLAWVPCALAPSVVLLGPRGSLRAALGAAVGLALVEGPLTLPVAQAVLAGRLHSFVPGARALLVERGALAGVGVTALVVGARFARVGAPARAALGVGGVTVAAAWATDVLRGDARVVEAAHLHLFLPLLLGAAAVLASSAGRRGAALLLGVALVHAARERALLTRPTDAEELAWALTWRETLPPGAEVAAVQRAGERLLTLPLYPGKTARPVAIDADGRAVFAEGPRFYVRTSLCATEEGKARCASFERTHTLRPLDRRTLVTRASLPWLPLPAGTVDVALFAVD